MAAVLTGAKIEPWAGVQNGGAQLEPPQRIDPLEIPRRHPGLNHEISHDHPVVLRRTHRAVRRFVRATLLQHEHLKLHPHVGTPKRGRRLAPGRVMKNNLTGIVQRQGEATNRTQDEIGGLTPDKAGLTSAHPTTLKNERQLPAPNPTRWGKGGDTVGC